mgnify:CR=1 FL=1
MFSSVENIIHELEAARKSPFLVGIDGLSGAGKSTIADRLRELLPNVEVVRKDDFYRVMDEAVRFSLAAEQGYQQYFDWQRLERQVLRPISAGQSTRYQRYDWVREALAETIELSSHSIVVVEGVCSTRPELRDYYHLRIWVETSEPERLRRQIARGENSIEWISRWAAAESYYVEKFSPRDSAHRIVAGDSGEMELGLKVEKRGKHTND